jgi:DNA-binding CsgD family transcriptional regulator
MADAFLAAAIEPQRWTEALRQFAEATGSDHAQLIGIGPDYSVGFNWVSGMTAADHALSDHAELMMPQTNYRVAAGMTAPPGAIVCEDRYDAVKPHLIDDAYLDLCTDLRIPYGCQTTLSAGGGGILGLALLRSHRTGPTTAEAEAAFTTARSSVAAAAALQMALEQEGHRLVAGGFEAMGSACFVLDRSMTVRAVTAPAEALLHQGVMRLSDGRVGLPGAGDERRLLAAMASVVDGQAIAGNVAVPDGVGVLVLKLHRLPEREWNMGFAPFAILIAKRSGGVSTVDLAFLRNGYGLTMAEAEIALLLRAGQTRDAICAARGIARETLRSHLRALFAKLGVSRETEAIHLLHALLS